VNKIVPSDLIVIDGLYSLPGRGRSWVSLSQRNVIIAANNVVAADGIICRFFKMEPNENKASEASHPRKARLDPEGHAGDASPHETRRSDSDLREQRWTISPFSTFKSRIINKANNEFTANTFAIQSTEAVFDQAEKEKCTRKISEGSTEPVPARNK